MNISVLTYLDSEDENSKEYDPVVPQVARTLRRLGHRVSIMGVHGDVKRRQLERHELADAVVVRDGLGTQTLD